MTFCRDDVEVTRSGDAVSVLSSYFLGRALKELGSSRYPEALNQYRLAVTADPSDLEALLGLVDMLEKVRCCTFQPVTDSVVTDFPLC